MKTFLGVLGIFWVLNQAIERARLLATPDTYYNVTDT